MYRKIATATAILAAGLAVGAPAFALLGGPGANDRPHLASEPGSGPGGGVTTTTKPGQRPRPPKTDEPRPSTTTTAKRPEEPRPPKPTTTAPPVTAEERREIERMRLACVGGRTRDMGATKCEWSPSHSPAFAGYVLWRQDPGATERRVVFETTDVTMLHYYDKPLGPGTYTYGVLALDGARKGVGAGGPATATVPTAPPPATTAPPTTAPKPGTAAFGCMVDGSVVVCKWVASTSERFGSYRLYREVPGTPAQLRRTITDRGVTSATDGDVTPGASYTYRIVILDTNGQPLAYGGPSTVTIPTGGTGDAPKQ